jgi:hypothetical protein
MNCEITLNRDIGNGTYIYQSFDINGLNGYIPKSYQFDYRPIEVGRSGWEKLHDYNITLLGIK